MLCVLCGDVCPYLDALYRNADTHLTWIPLWSSFAFSSCACDCLLSQIMNVGPFPGTTTMSAEVGWVWVPHLVWVDHRYGIFVPTHPCAIQEQRRVDSQSLTLLLFVETVVLPDLCVFRSTTEHHHLIVCSPLTCSLDFIPVKSWSILMYFASSLLSSDCPMPFTLSLFAAAQICYGLCNDLDPFFTHFGTQYSSEVCSPGPLCVLLVFEG